MGRLIHKLDFRGGPNRRRGSDHGAFSPVYDGLWFFADRQNAKIEDSYPIKLSIHVDQLDGGHWDKPTVAEAGASRIEIRKLIERRMEGDVVYDVEHLTHVRVNPPYGSDKKRYGSSIPHGYYHFYFENDADAVFFKMHFGELVSDPTAHHPAHPPADGFDDFHGPNAHMEARRLTSSVSF